MQILKPFSKSMAFLCLSVAFLIISIALPHYAQDDSTNTSASIPKSPETAEEYLKAGINLQKKGNYKAATPLFQQALGLYSQEENWNKIDIRDSMIATLVQQQRIFKTMPTPVNRTSTAKKARKS